MSSSEPLVSKTCTPCRGGVPPLTREEVEAHRSETPDWTVRDGPDRIERRFPFKDFAEAFAFVSKAADLAEAEGHHPDITFGWGYATRLALHPQDQGPARERLHHGREARPDFRDLTVIPGGAKRREGDPGTP